MKKWNTIKFMGFTFLEEDFFPHFFVWFTTASLSKASVISKIKSD